MKNATIKFELTTRGFAINHFTDRNGQDCLLQESSICADKDGAYIWLGCNNPEGKFAVFPQMMTDATSQALGLHSGWNEKSLKKMFPDCDINTSDRMHLSQKMVKKLLPALQYFVKTGSLPVDKQ